MNYKKEAKELANKVLEKLEEENGKIEYPIDPFKLLKQNNIIITFSDFEKLEGIILNDEDNITIVSINRLRPWTRQRFTAAHEYCHYLKDLKREYNKEDIIDCLTNSQSKIEKFADEFASHLLMPTIKLKELCDKYKNEKGYVEFESITLIAEFFGVSFSCCLNRIAYELNMIEGNTTPQEIAKKVKKYQPDKKSKELIRDNNDYRLLSNIVNSLKYCMIDLNNNTGIKFLNNYIYFDNKLEGIIQEETSYILADLSYNKEKSKFYNSNDEKIIMTLGNYKLQEYVLTTKDKIDIRKCKDLHKLLNSYTPFSEFSGKYRESEAIISKGTIQPKSYLMINYEIEKLAKDFDKFIEAVDKIDISEYIEESIKFMYRFIIIHPFSDGNGRISRALLNWMLRLKNIPPIYIDDKSRQEYYETLSQIDLNRDFKPLTILVEKRIINTLIELHDYLFLEETNI